MKRVHILIIRAENKNDLKSDSTIETEEARALLFILRRHSYHYKAADAFFSKIVELDERLQRVLLSETITT